MSEVFSTSLSNVSERGHFRSGALYRSVWDVHKGELFKGVKLAYPKARLRNLIYPYKAQILKKGLLGRKYILIDLEDIEARRGRIREGRRVSSIGSNKILFGNADLLFSKIRPYLGYAIINDKSQPYIGTTELVPFKVRKSVPEYVKYLMLTKEFLGFAILLMYGKEHPRIDVEDLLNIVVPCPPIEKQQEIVEDLSKNIETRVDSLKAKIIPLQIAIDDIFQREGVKKSAKTHSLTIFQSNFKSIGNQKYVRCGARYRFFWDIRQGKLFTNSKYPIERLGNLAEICNYKLLRKGALDSDYILVDLPDIIPREGRIRNEVRTVNEIGSDKILFGDSELLYSHIDPFLGHVILNDKTKPYIGTTELVPLKTKEGIDPRFVRYLLLSQDFLDSSRYLMYGKRHPRIHIVDMKNLQVPRPDSANQQKISEQIWQVEKSNIALEEEIDKLYRQVDDFLLRHLRV